MRNALVKAFLGVAILFCAFSVASADAVLKYELTPEKIKEAWVVRNNRGYYEIVIEVKEPYREELPQLTGNNIERMFEIISSAGRFSAEVIKTKDELDIIVSLREWSSKEEAERFRENLIKDSVAKGVEELAEDRDIVWARTFGGELEDKAYSVRQTTDGGYIIAGITRLFRLARRDVYLIKTDSSGKEEWSKTFIRNGYSRAHSVQQTNDGGYIIVGATHQSEKEIASDYYLIKTDSLGNEEWSKAFGGEKYDGAGSVQQTTDGGYIIAGDTDSYGSGQTDFYLIKTDSSGNEEWSKTFGGEKDDWATSVQQTTDGGYIVAGSTDSYGSGLKDFYLIKTDSSGNEEWSKTFGGEKDDWAHSVQQTTDGGYIVAGSTDSYGSGLKDFYLIKTDSSGNEEWSKTFGGKITDIATSVQQTTDGGYIVAGYAGYTGYPYPNGSDSSDVYLIKTDSSGNEEWSKTFGGKMHDSASSIQQTRDGGYVIAGVTRSYGNGFTDVLLIKLAPKPKKKPEKK